MTAQELLSRIRNHNLIMAPHQRERQAGKLLIESEKAIEFFISRETDLVKAAHNLMRLLHKSGSTADWPIDIVARDKEHADLLCQRLTDVEKAIEAYNIKLPKTVRT